MSATTGEEDRPTIEQRLSILEGFVDGIDYAIEKLKKEAALTHKDIDVLREVAGF